MCLHEKELTTCVSDANCKPQEYCAKINSNAYCVTRPSVALAAAIKPAAAPKTAAAGLGWFRIDIIIITIYIYLLLSIIALFATKSHTSFICLI